MKALLLGEWHRLRRLALGFALLHLGVLAGMAFYGDLFVPSPTKVRLGLAAYGLGGLLLGVAQFAVYRRQNLWSFLLHRPLAPGKIFLALAATGGLVLALVIALPLLLVTLLLDGFSAQWVDGRQYLMVPFLWGLAMAFYVGGGYLALRARWSAALVLVLVLPCLNGAVPDAWVFVPLVLGLVWLGGLALTAFQPDLSASPRGIRATVLEALPTQCALFPAVAFVLVLVYSVAVIHWEAGWRGFAVFGWNDYFPIGSYERAAYLDHPELVAHALRLGDSPRGPGLAVVVAGAEDGVEGGADERVALWPEIGAAPVRHALLFQERGESLLGPDGATRWVFSHDRMQFHGRNTRTGAAVGWLEPPLAEVPVVAADGAMVAGGGLYQVEFGAGRVERLWQAPSGERLMGPAVPFDGGEAILSDGALYLSDDSGWSGSPTALPLPGTVENLERAVVVKLPESRLITFFLGQLSERDAYPARLVVLELAETGAVTTITDRALVAGAPAWVRHRGFLVSPLLQALVDFVWRDPMAPRWRQIPNGVWAAALGLALVSMFLTAGLARRRGPGTAFWLWTAMGFFCGLPAFVSLLLLRPRSEP
jgi:hypothetical protein